MQTSLIRSLLPVGNPTRETLQLAVMGDADALLVDLEDSVHSSRKRQAREAVMAFMRVGQFHGTRVLVRVNDVLTETGLADLTAAVTAGTPDIILPKVRSPTEVSHAESMVRRAEAERAVPVGTTRFWIMLETTDAIVNLKELGDAPRVAGFILGGGDLSSELRVRRIGLGAERHIWETPLELLYSKQLAVLVARSKGLEVVDTGFTTVTDLEGTARAARISAQLGFDGTLAHSPSQIPPIHEEFTPSVDEYEWACRALDAIAQADSQCETKAVVDGKAFGGPFVKGARSIRTRYEATQRK